MNTSSHQNSTTADQFLKDGNTTSYDVNVYIIYLTFRFIALLLQLAVQFIIHKERLHDNQHQLIRLESIVESLHLLTAIILVSDSIRRDDKNPDKRFLSFMTFLAHVWSSLSVISNVFISVDRWAAVKFALRYQAMFTKKKLGGVFLLVAFVDVFVLSCMCFIGEVSNTILINNIMFTSRAILGYIATLRAIACTAIIILGKKTIQYRDQNEARIRSLNNVHGSDAEELDLMIVLKRGIKDVLKVNMWNCIFLIPTIFVIIVNISPIKKPNWVFRINPSLLSL